MAVDLALATVRDAPFVVDVLRAADDLSLAAREGGLRAADMLTRAIHDENDELTAIAALHALGRIFDDRADAVLSDLLSHDRAFLREHAAWSLGGRLPRLDAIGRLVAVVAAGGFSGMLAQRTLGTWARSASDHVALAVEGAVAGQPDPAVRARLVETLGLVPGALAGRAILRLAADDTESDVVRAAAVAALGDRGGAFGVRHADLGGRAADLGGAGTGPVDRLIAELATGEGELAAVARLAALDLTSSVPTPAASGATVAQLFLHADIDRDLSRAGAGDNGGVATLLLRLGDALVAEPGVGRVLTLSRGSAESAFDVLGTPADGHVLAPLTLMGPAVGSAQAWPARVAAERGIRRILRRLGPVDVLHLRMADVGSLAADAVARELGIATVFTLAPDPHAVIHSLDMTGALTRGTFGAADEVEHYWFRSRLVQRLAADAAHTVLFPRARLQHDLHDLLGLDVEHEPHRYTVVPEGIDLAVTRAAAREAARGSEFSTDGLAPPPPAVAELLRLVGDLPPERQGLPLVLSVGRLHRVKGMATLVEAWAADADLCSRSNLVIVGGDLEHPSPDEQGQLDRIRLVAPAGSPAAAGLVLAGHRPNDVVARWLAVTRHGSGHTIAPGGVYACGSLKEEFGLALLEALAAGLVVVAPDGGGPATYVEPGVTGLLVDTRDPARVHAGLAQALRLAAAPGAAARAERGMALVRERFTVQAMAASLAGVYAAVGQRAVR